MLIGTLGKAFGSYGAFVAGSAELIEFLVQKARPYIYTTALPQPVAAATRAALGLIHSEGWRRERVADLTALFRALATGAGLPLADSATPISRSSWEIQERRSPRSAHCRRQDSSWWLSAHRPCPPAAPACASPCPRPTRKARSGSWSMPLHRCAVPKEPHA